MTKKEKLQEEAKGIEGFSDTMTIPQLEKLIADNSDKEETDELGLEVVGAEIVGSADTVGEGSVGPKVEIDVEPLCNEMALKAIADCANGSRPDARNILEGLVRKCIKS